MTRILTAAALIGVLGTVLWLPWPAYAVFACVVALLGWREFVALSRAAGASPAAAPGAFLVAAMVLSFAPGVPVPGEFALLGALVLSLLAALRQESDPAGLLRGFVATALGVLWIGGMLGAQLGLRAAPQGVVWLLLLFGSVALGDSCAYYGGRNWGRRAMAPELSPKKTIEGLAFGVVGAALGAALVSQWISGLSVPRALLVGALLFVLGQCGDLLESALKRVAGRKDSSDLLPGHGGVLDRIDAHLPSAGALYLALTAGWLV